MITSKDNPQFKALKKLIHQPKRSDALMVVEGVHACQLLLKHQGMHHLRIEKVWVGRSALNDREVQSLLLQAQHQYIPVMELDGALFRELSSLEQGISVLFEVQRPAIEPMNFENITGNVVLLDGIQDPGTMGTINRIADWLGIEQIVCSTDSADPYNPKVVQATMGSIARVKIIHTDLKKWLEDMSDTQIFAAVLGGKDVSSINKISEGVIIIGNESKGISPELLKLSNIKIAIPAKGKAESLNAAIATGIILSHLI